METAIFHLKTKMKFQSIVPEFVMIIHQDYASDFKKIIIEQGGKIKEEHTPETRRDNKYGLVVTGLPLLCFNVFFMKNTIISIPEYTFALTNNIRVSFKLDYKNEYIDIISLSLKSGNKGDWHDWHDWITIRSNKPMGGRLIKGYEINWSAIGSCDAETAEMFATGMNAAVQLAKDCNAQFAEKPILTEK